MKLLERLWTLHARLFVSAAFGVAVALALIALPWRIPTRILLGWDIGVLLYLVLSYRTSAHASVATIRQRAAINDDGAIALLVLATGAALASLAAVLVELGHAPGWYQVALGVSTILLSWTFLHWIFARTMRANSMARPPKSTPAGSCFPARRTRTIGTFSITRTRWS